MSFNFKMVFLWWHFLWCLWRLKAMVRKYRRMPDELTPQQRNDYLLKRAKQLLWYFNVKINVEGYSDLPKSPALLLPNHKSNIDPLIILAALEKKDFAMLGGNKIPTFLGKIELKRKKFASGVLELLDTIFINRQDLRQSLKSLNEFGDFVKNNKRYGVIFPEGTRITTDELGEFKAGAIKVAQSQYLTIVPVSISDTRQALNKNRGKKLLVNVKFLKPIKPADFLAMDNLAIANRVKNEIEMSLDKNE
ncbi:1-acyl-sn-glycerol-3-phosphate acyltransferase [Mycoplasma sp. ES3157-GEN-MYC]|uniref:lysophospholipid acyltransferase family protein n=1 Tax=Mycoplasma miroungigenitalium TaxID=754515 RepID=UPI001C11382B|nr:lysophospholipid acyltransferase family protein [Mycoplasma miroungigenitalium]MBU4690368.1 1-acyl-sn-glycerol-3-phosphate acyltransferase [Mycoplasma miroungigenitalium]